MTEYEREAIFGMTPKVGYYNSGRILMTQETDAGQQIKSMMQGSSGAAWGRGIVGAAIGGAIGVYAFKWLLTQGYYGLALPAILLAIGFSICARRSMLLGGVFCAIVGLMLMIFSEWNTSPFVKDESLGYFLQNLTELQSVTQIFMAIGTAAAFWFGRGR